MSKPSEDDWKRMADLVKTFHNRPDAEPFREPVAWKELGLTDYPVIIKEPMDLGTVQKKLKARDYKSLYAVADDVRKVWRNCMTYNADGSDFYKLAESLQKKWDDKYAKFLQESSLSAPAGGGGSASESNITDRRNFAKSLYTISKEDLGKVLVEIESKCPAAIIRNSSEDEIELNVDKIPSVVLQELTSYISSSTGKKKGGKKTATLKKQRTS